MRPRIEDFVPTDLQSIALLDVVCKDVANRESLFTSNVYEYQNEDHSDEDSDDSYKSLEATCFLFGTSLKGHSVALYVRGYMPTLRYEIQGSYDVDKIRNVLKSELPNQIMQKLKIRFQKLKRFQGYVPDEKNPLEAKKFQYVELRVPSFQMQNKVRRLLEKSAFFVQTDKSTHSSTSFCNELGLTMSGWFGVHPDSIRTVRKRNVDAGWSTCQIEVDLDLGFDQREDDSIEAICKNSLCPLEMSDLPPWIACSFDCEMMSQDGTMPNVSKADHTIQLCATFWNLAEGLEKTAQRQAFTLTDKLNADGIRELKEKCTQTIVVPCKTSADLIEQFRKTLIDFDVDAITGWNIYGYDFPFLFQEYSSQFENASKKGSQEFASELWSYVNPGMPKRPTTKDLFVGLTGKPQWTVWNQVKRNQPQLSKNHNEWPENVAWEIRKLIAETKNLRYDEWDYGVVPTKNHLSKKATTGDLIAQRFALMTQSKAQKSGFYWSRFRTEESQLQIRQMASSAKGDNTYSIWSCNGRVTLDLMQIIKDDKKPESNSLRQAAEHWLSATELKKDLDYHEMFQLYKNGTLDGLVTITDYCVRDADIPALLIDKLNYVSTWIEMSRVTFTSLGQVLNGGQQRKVQNVIARFVANEQAINVRPSGWPLEPDLPEIDGEEDALKKRKPDQQGATVIEPEPGHYESPVSVLDFESLYPSIIIFFNLCASNLVLDKFSEDILQQPGFEIESHVIEHNILEDPINMIQKTQQNTYTFVKHSPGVLPRLLRHLLKSRKGVKALMASETDAFKKAVLNGRQNGLKIVCNSVYGFCGVSASKGLLPCKPVAAVTTLKGRSFIDSAKNYVEEHYKGSKVLYGDSVPGDTPILIRQKEKYTFMTITQICESSSNLWTSWHQTKEACETNFSVWTEKGFVACNRLIRHRLEKRMYRIVTTRGIVDVTEDHSLLKPDGSIAKPKEVCVGDPLMIAPSLNIRRELSSLDSSFFTNAATRPSEAVLQSYSKIEACGMIHDMESFGYFLKNVSENEEEDDEMELCFSLERPKDPFAEITSIRELKVATQYVQDLQTANHHFHVGPGHLVVHNTDSIMIKWHCKPDGSFFTIPEAYDLGEESSKAITTRLRTGMASKVSLPVLEDARNAVTLANEKVQCPQLLLKKKNQAGVKWTPSKKSSVKVPGFGFELDMKGIDAVRRDRTKIVRETSEKVLEEMLIQGNLKASVKVLESILDNILEDKVNVDDFVLSKSLKGSYASENVPHVQAWLRMKARGDAGCPEKGGRMPILIVEPQGDLAKKSSDKVPLYQRCEHPDFVKNSEGRIQLCKTQYLEGIRETFERLQKPTAMADYITNLFDSILEKEKHLKSKNMSIRSFFQAKDDRGQSLEAEALQSVSNSVSNVSTKPLKKKRKTEEVPNVSLKAMFQK